MPLRDHFRPPVSTRASWEGFHGGWPMVIVQQLRKQLPAGYVSEPRVHLGAQVEIDVVTFENDEALTDGRPDAGGGTATAVWAPAAPSVAARPSWRTTTPTRSASTTPSAAGNWWRPSRS